MNRILSLVFLLALNGCQPEPIASYRAPKEAAVPPAASAPSGAAHREIDWTVPSGWTELPASNMRIGSFLATGKDGKKADISIVALSGDAGGDLSNINRWRGQIDLPGISEADLDRESRLITTGGRRMRLVDFVNLTSKNRVVAAIYKDAGKTWFFKMTGEDAMLESTKPAFLDFLAGLNIHRHE